MFTSNSVLKHGRVLNFCCKNNKSKKEGKKNKKRNVLNKNGSNQSSRMSYARIVGANRKNVARGYVESEKCDLFSLRKVKTKTFYDCSNIMAPSYTKNLKVKYGACPTDNKVITSSTAFTSVFPFETTGLFWNAQVTKSAWTDFNLIIKDMSTTSIGLIGFIDGNTYIKNKPVGQKDPTTDNYLGFDSESGAVYSGYNYTTKQNVSVCYVPSCTTTSNKAVRSAMLGYFTGATTTYKILGFFIWNRGTFTTTNGIVINNTGNNLIIIVEGTHTCKTNKGWIANIQLSLMNSSAGIGSSWYGSTNLTTGTTRNGQGQAVSNTTGVTRGSARLPNNYSDSLHNAGLLLSSREFFGANFNGKSGTNPVTMYIFPETSFNKGVDITNVFKAATNDVNNILVELQHTAPLTACPPTIITTGTLITSSVLLSSSSSWTFKASNYPLGGTSVQLLNANAITSTKLRVERGDTSWGFDGMIMTIPNIFDFVGHINSYGEQFTTTNVLGAYNNNSFEPTVLEFTIGTTITHYRISYGGVTIKNIGGVDYYDISLDDTLPSHITAGIYNLKLYVDVTSYNTTTWTIPWANYSDCTSANSLTLTKISSSVFQLKKGDYSGTNIGVLDTINSIRNIVGYVGPVSSYANTTAHENATPSILEVLNTNNDVSKFPTLIEFYDVGGTIISRHRIKPGSCTERTVSSVKVYNIEVLDLLPSTLVNGATYDVGFVIDGNIF